MLRPCWSVKVLLRESIRAGEPGWAMAVVFLLDRFFYMVDGSDTLLKIAKALHRRHPGTPVAPQMVIRQARVYLNTGEMVVLVPNLKSVVSVVLNSRKQAEGRGGEGGGG